MHLEQVHGVREPGDDVVDPSLWRLHHLGFDFVAGRLCKMKKHHHSSRERDKRVAKNNIRLSSLQSWTRTLIHSTQ